MVETVLKNLEKGAEWNKLNSLDSKEKQELQNLSVEAIQKQKADLGNVTFDVWSKKGKRLEEIVKNFSTATGCVEWKDAKGNVIERVKVEKRSDLAAAIQVFVLANGKHISVNPIAANNEAKWIDGIVWTNTKSWIDAYKNTVREVKPKKPDVVNRTQFERCTVKGLGTYPFAKVFDSIAKGKSRELKKMNVLDEDWCLRKSKYRIKGSEAIIYYVSNIDGKSHSINFNIKKDLSWEVDVLQFAKDIVTKINNAEKVTSKEKREAGIVSSIESFDIRKFSAKAQQYLKDHRFVAGNKLDLADWLFSWTWIAFDWKWNLHFWSAFYMTKSQVDSLYVNWKFSEDKFKSILGPYLDRKANEYYLGKANKALTSLKSSKVTIGWVPEVETSIQNTENLMNRYVKLWISNLPDYKKILENKRQEVSDMKKYADVYKWMHTMLSEIEKKINKSMSPVEIKNIKDMVISMDAWLAKKSYMYNNENVYGVYSKVANGEQEYKKLVARVKNIKNQIV